MHSPRLSPGASRAALLEGAIECLRDRGYARTTARDIAAASGANLAAIGYHYGSKEALLIAALGESCRRWVDELAVAAGSEGDGGAGLRGADPLAVFASNRGLCVGFVEALAAAQHSPELRAELAQLYRDLREGLAALLTRDSSRPSSPEASAQASALLAVVDGLMIQWLLEPEDVPSSGPLLAGLRALGG